MTDIRATWASWKRDAKCGCTDPDPAVCTAGCEPSPRYTRECPCHYLTNRASGAAQTTADGPTPAALVEVRDPCPHCDDHQLIPRRQMVEHVSRLHPDADRAATLRELEQRYRPNTPPSRPELRRMADAPGLPQCPTCGRTPTEPHPRRAGVDRCANCKTHAPACSGTVGLCDVHGAHRHAPAPDGPRDETLIKYPSDADEAFSELTRLQALARNQREELQRLRTETATADQLRADVQRDRDRLLTLLGDAVGWIHEGELREQISAALNAHEPPPEPTAR